jgi:alpha-1,2-mannosyltransferase
MRSTRANLRPLVVPVVLGLLCFAALVSWIVVTHLTATPSQRLVDLDVYRDGGRSVLLGRPIYSFASHAPQHLRFTYPPIAAILAIPLAWVPFNVAGWVWTVGELACTLVITWVGFRPLLARFGRWWPLALGVLAGAMQQMLPFRDEIKFGQVDELLVVLCVVDCLVLTRKKYGGSLIGLSTALKLTPGVFIVYLFVTGRRRAAAVVVGVFVAVTLLAVAVSPSDSRTYWTDALFHPERLRSNANTSNQAIRGMWLRVVHGPHLVTLLWIGCAVVVAVLGYVRAARAGRSDGEQGETTGIALTGLLAVLLSPVAWIHHLVWLPLVFGVVADDGRDARRVLWAAATYAFFVVKVPWIGAHWLATGGPVVPARLLQDGYGLAALVLLVTLRTRSVTGIREPLAQPVTLRHNGGL